MGKTQKYLAEALGTFALVGIGSFAILSSAGTGRLDVVAPGKDGLVVFYNDGPA